MSRLPQDTRLDEKAAARPADVARTLSRSMSETRAALKGLTFRENVQAEWHTFDVTVQGDEVTPATTVAADLEAHLTDATDAHDASAISLSAISGLSATQVQAAIAKHQTDIDARYTKTEADSRFALAADHSRVYVRAAGGGPTASPATPAWRVVTFAEQVDTHAAWDGSRFTVPAGADGLYTINAAVAFSGLAAGVLMGIGILINNAVAHNSMVYADAAYCQAVIGMTYNLVAGDFVEIRVIQHGGSPENTSTDTGDTWVSVARVSK